MRRNGPVEIYQETRAERDNEFERANEWRNQAEKQRLLLKASLLFNPVTDEMVNRFLRWPLPDSVCSDECVTRTGGEWTPEYPQRTGTNLLTADEARKMLEHVLGHR